MKKSSKHHYLPKFYLKGFTNENGQFAVYDCKNKRVKNHMFNPSSHFFEKDRNTIEINGTETDFLEEAYAKFDNRHAKLFKLIQDTEKTPLLNNNQKTFLQEFISHIFWRIPANDKLYKKEYIANSNFYKTFKIRDKKTKQEVNNTFTEELKQSEPFIKAVRAFAGNISLLSYTNTNDYNNWQISYNQNGFKLCSDSPIIFKKENPKNIFESDFIFPLTKKHLLVRTFNSLEIKFLTPKICLMIDLIIFKQAELYSCCLRRDYLESIHSIADKHGIDALKRKVFDYLEMR